MSKLLVGADPELFVTREGKPFSAFGLVPGTKYDPHPVNRGTIQVDGMALEIGIVPASSLDEFTFSLETVMQELRKAVPDGFVFSKKATAHFSKQHMKEQPEEARALGCDPDFNAYTMKINPPPKADPMVRAAGGHLHAGFTTNMNPHEPDHFNYCCEFVKQLDYTNGLVGTILDEDDERKKQYGKAGSFRPKPYGLEWRVNSNFWLFDKKYQQLMFENMHLAFNRMNEGEFFTETYGETTAQDIINNNDKASAIDLCERAGIPFDVE
jgi:hypothetical protein